MRLFFLLLPWLELFTLIKLGVETTAFTAILYVAATFALGIVVIRRQGQGVFNQLRDAQQGRVLGAQLMLDDMAMVLAGLLFIFPGMITDVFAVLAMIGPLRRRISSWIMGPQPEAYVPERDDSSHVTIEGDFRRMDR
jgi:UPF0716 protein FxsA